MGTFYRRLNNSEMFYILLSIVIYKIFHCYATSYKTNVCDEAFIIPSLKIISFYYVNIFSVKSGEPVQTNNIFFIKQKSIYYTMIISHDNSKFLTYRQFEKLHKETSVPCTH